VLEQTEQAVRRAGRTVRRLPGWYDVDDVAGLARLYAELFDSTMPDGRAPHTRAFLADVWGRLGLRPRMPPRG
jgi:hypothetical protein